MSLGDILGRVGKFEATAHKIFGRSEVAASRIVLLSTTLDSIEALSINQEDMLRQAVRCIEVAVFRAAHVLAWAAAVDYLQEFAGSDSFKKLNAARPKWNITAVEDLRENYAEYNFVEAMYAAKLINKSEWRAFQGLLARRNDCAHPSQYFPDLNEALGYVSEIIRRINTHKKRVAYNP